MPRVRRSRGCTRCTVELTGRHLVISGGIAHVLIRDIRRQRAHTSQQGDEAGGEDRLVEKISSRRGWRHTEREKRLVMNDVIPKIFERTSTFIEERCRKIQIMVVVMDCFAVRRGWQNGVVLPDTKKA